MKILFSNPPWWEVDETRGALRIGIRAGSRWPFTRYSCHGPDCFQFGAYLPTPFFLGYAAAYTAREFPQATVELRDSIARGESYEAFIAHVKHARPDWLVIETATPSWEHDERLLGHVADALPGVRIILCGTMDAAKAKQVAAEHKQIAAIVRGEYDKQIAKVISGNAAGVVAHDLLTTAEMNAAPLPMWDEAAALHYWDGCPPGHRPPQLQIWTSRGCPFRCCFCVWPATMTGNDPDGTGKRAVRCYSPAYVERLLRDRIAWAITRGTPYQSIYLDDDTFNLGDEHTLAICDVMQRIGLPWSAMCRADTIKRETWQAMHAAGCYGVKIGFESGSQWVIDHIVNKRLNLAEAEETARFILSLGMTVHGTFTVGLPGESAEQRRETLDSIQRLHAEGALDTHQLSGASEIEGTPLHTLRTRGHLKKYDGAKIDSSYTADHDGQRKIETMKRRGQL